MKRQVYRLTLRRWMALQQAIAQRHPSKRVNQWFKWLAPGLLVKRWLLLSAGGMVLMVLGLAIWTKMTPIFYGLQIIQTVLTHLAAVIPSSVSGPLILVGGALLIFWGQARTLDMIAEVLVPEGDEQLIDLLLTRRRLNRGPKVVAIGGGTGLSTLLRGLKEYSANITAIVTVADDGGSSGRLRREIGVLPPGDIRNCLTALAAEEKLMTELFRYRFEAGDGLVGHSFGNLFLTAMSEITGDLEQAVAASSQVLAVRGRVLPSTLADVSLWAEMDDGQRIEGESKIPEAHGTIIKIGCTPPNPPALPRAIEAIREADYIIVGPGSLYTSVIPNLLIPEIAWAITESPAPCIYVCNVMSQPGETHGYTVADHIQAIDRACEPICGDRLLFDTVLVQKGLPQGEARERYARGHSYPVVLDRDAVNGLGRRVVRADIADVDPETGFIRHDSVRLARVLMRWYDRLLGFTEESA